MPCLLCSFDAFITDFALIAIFPVIYNRKGCHIYNNINITTVTYQRIILLGDCCLYSTSSNSSEPSEQTEGLSSKPLFEPIEVFTNIHLKETKDDIRKKYSKMRGIYSFQCLITNNYYIGSAQSLYNRFYLHTGGYHSNIILQNAIKKYGLNNFVFSIYKAVPKDSNLLGKLELQQLESDLIASFDYKILYNLTLNSATNKGLKHSPEAILKMKEARASYIHPLDRPVYVYDKDLNLLAYMDSITQAGDKLGIDRNVLASYLGTNKVWRNLYIFKEILVEGSTMEGLESSLLQPVKKYLGSEKSLFVYDLEGNLLYEFASRLAGSKQLGVHNTNIGDYIKSGKP